LLSREKQEDECLQGAEDRWEKFVSQLQLLEVDRVGFMLRDYLRLRLRKVEEFFRFVSSAEEERAKLSVPEQRYLDRYQKLMDRHIDESFVEALPGPAQTVDEDIFPRPDLDKFVFCRAARDIEDAITLDPVRGDRGIFMEGDVWLVKYRAIRPYVEDGSVDLV
jgi:GINS complex subunit 4